MTRQFTSFWTKETDYFYSDLSQVYGVFRYPQLEQFFLQ